MRTGRRRNPNAIRDESGKSRGERFDPEPFLNQPHRKPFAGKKYDDDGRDIAATDAVGYPLARLHANGLLTTDQLNAGNHYKMEKAFGREKANSVAEQSVGVSMTTFCDLL